MGMREELRHVVENALKMKNPRGKVKDVWHGENTVSPEMEKTLSDFFGDREVVLVSDMADDSEYGKLVYAGDLLYLSDGKCEGVDDGGVRYYFLIDDNFRYVEMHDDTAGMVNSLFFFPIN